MGGDILSPIFILLALLGPTASGAENVKLAFEDKYAGFFLKNGHANLAGQDTSVLVSHDRLVVLHSSSTAMVRASYGPFAAKETVPSLALMPVVSLNRSADLFSHFADGAGPDVSAYLVTEEPRRERPVLRVLFHFSHGGSRAVGHANPGAGKDYQTFCAILVVVKDGRRRLAVCSAKPRKATCLAEMTVPYSWWPQEVVTDGPKSRKGQKVVVSVEYAVAIDAKRAECTEAYVSDNMPNPMTTTPLWQLPLSSEVPSVREVPGPVNSSVKMFVPDILLYPGSRFYVSTMVQRSAQNLLNAFVVRASIKNGLKVVGVEPAESDTWSLQVTMNPRRNWTEVSVSRQSDMMASNAEADNEEDGLVEVLHWLLEVDKKVAKPQRTAHIVWSLRKNSGSRHPLRTHPLRGGTASKVSAELLIEKDDIQAVLLISKTWELVNTAVLTGEQVSRPMKAFIVSHAGKMADVTLQASCASVDESILKVSPSCTSVYLDGSEIRGSHNATVTVKYGTYVGQARFTVWIPEMPLDVQLEDTNLNQIKNWTVPKELPRKLQPRTRSSGGNVDGHVVCRPRYQQTPVEVYARFFAVDDNSGRKSFLVSRKAAFRVTNLVEANLRVADTGIAALKGRTLRGQSVGRTEVQILCPIKGHVIGAREVRVGKEEEVITALKVNMVTGLQLSLRPTYDLARGYVAETTITRKLTAQYQEGVLDVAVEFSDGVVTPLSDIAESDFQLSVRSLDEGILVLAPAASPLRPRVIAVGAGSGNLLWLTLEPTDSCHRRDTGPLAATLAPVEVIINTSKERGGIQNDFLAESTDGVKRFRGEPNPSKGSGVDSRHRPEPSVQAQHHPFEFAEMSVLEMGMYAIVGVVCFAIAIFVVSCAVYAVRFHRKRVDGGGSGDSVSNAHDWVWLGRSTLERTSAGPRRAPTPSPTPPRPRPTVEHHGPALLRRLARSYPIEEVGTASERSDSSQMGCPPVPPPRDGEAENRRRAKGRSRGARRVETSDDGDTPPPVPPHGRPSPDVGRSSSQNRKLRAVRELTWNSRAGMNYDQLMEYFGNLKESNA